MSCKWCQGSGWYYPLVGPAEPCRECKPNLAFDPSAFRMDPVEQTTYAYIQGANQWGGTIFLDRSIKLDLSQEHSLKILGVHAVNFSPLERRFVSTWEMKSFRIISIEDRAVGIHPHIYEPGAGRETVNALPADGAFVWIR